MDIDRLLKLEDESKWFRPASGWFNRRMLGQARELGYRCCLVSIYPQDTKLKAPDWVGGYILDRIKPGSIVVLHDGEGREQTYQVLIELLPELKRRGYSVMTVSELVALQDKSPAETEP